MPSIITHAAVPLAIWWAAGSQRVSPRLLAAGIAASVLPDADVAAFALGIPYEAALGHRGASHSVLFATAVAALAALAAPTLRSRRRPAALFTFICAASHPLLDALTSGGLGVALLWPWESTRYFAPWRPIRVSPFAGDFFNARGLATLWSELHWVWLPLFAAACVYRLIQRRGKAHDA